MNDSLVIQEMGRSLSEIASPMRRYVVDRFQYALKRSIFSNWVRTLILFSSCFERAHHKF